MLASTPLTPLKDIAVPLALLSEIVPSGTPVGAGIPKRLLPGVPEEIKSWFDILGYPEDPPSPVQ